jgi:hypothetical protein
MINLTRLQPRSNAGFREQGIIYTSINGEVGNALSARSDAFIEDGVSNQGIASIRRPLDRAVKATADAAVAFYRAEADRYEDAHNFLRVDQLEPRFQKFLRRRDSKLRRERIRSAVRDLEKALADAET